MSHFIQKLREHYMRMGGLHHAYLLDRSTRETHGALFEFFESDLGMRTAGNPDIWAGSYESFGIDDAKELRERASRSALDTRKIFVIEMQFITVQAQNALLKLLEEPSSTTHFFILMPNADVLLSTVISRLMWIVVEGGRADGEKDSRIQTFLAQNPSQRVAFLKAAPEIVEDKKAAVAFINSLEEFVYSNASVPRFAQSLEEIELCRGYMYDTSASVKMLLEHLAVSLPTFK